MQTISMKIRWMVLILSINIITIIAFDIWLNSDQKLDVQLINKAGKQRMLSQRTVLELHRFLLMEEGAFEKMQEARTEFDKNFKELSIANEQYRSFSNTQIQKTMLEVHAHWNHMGGLIDRYLQGDHNLEDLKHIYEDGDKTLHLMNHAVNQYENNMMEKRVMANRIQMLLAVISLVVIFYMARLTLGIKRDFEKFLEHSKTISGVSDVSASGSELDIACAHIGHFLEDVESALTAAVEEVKKSEIASANMIGLAPETDDILEQSEDMMIQMSEELHASVLRLQKLKSNFEKANVFRSGK